MNKKDYFKYLDSVLINLPVEKQLKEISKLKDWNKEYESKLIKGKKQCEYCQKYSKEKDFTISYEKKTSIETTYVDAGYGDDDRIGEVEYLYEITKCPLCGKSTKKRKQYIRTLWEKVRRK